MNAKQATTDNTTLTPAQRAILTHAHEHTEGRIIWFPIHIKGGARHKTREAMAHRALITQQGADWVIASEGYRALGIQREAHTSAPAANGEAQVQEAQIEQPTSKRQSATREGSKQAQVLAMLQRPEGVTIEQICQATGWQPHTVRGAFAGTFKKKLGLTITSTKAAGAARTYRAV